MSATVEVVREVVGLIEIDAPNAPRLELVRETFQVVEVNQQGPAGPEGGTVDMPDLSLIFENQLV